MLSTTSSAHHKGREAGKPTDIPSPGWKEILIRVYHEITNDRIMLVAAGTTFYLLLAMVPSLTALVSVYGLFAEPAGVQQHIAIVQDFMPSGGQEILAEQLQRLSSQPSTGLGITLAISLAIALWSSNAGMKALFEAMNVAYGEAEKRGFIKLTLVSLTFTVCAIILLLAMIGVVVVLPIVLGALGLGSVTGLAVRIGSAAVLVLVALTGLSALYRWGPSRTEARWRWITPGAAVAIVVALIASLLFSWYVANFGSYNETYGSLGAIIGFMTWLWIMVAFVITGGELNAEMEHQTRKDTTIGPEKHLGSRGAQMADTVAQGPHDTADPNTDRNIAAATAGSRQSRPGGQSAPGYDADPTRSSKPIGAVRAVLILAALAYAMMADSRSRAASTQAAPRRNTRRAPWRATGRSFWSRL